VARHEEHKKKNKVQKQFCHALPIGPEIPKSFAVLTGNYVLRKVQTYYMTKTKTRPIASD
jgi:hypothetical protein